MNNAVMYRLNLYDVSRITSPEYQIKFNFQPRPSIYINKPYVAVHFKKSEIKSESFLLTSVYIHTFYAVVHLYFRVKGHELIEMSVPSELNRAPYAF